MKDHMTFASQAEDVRSTRTMGIKTKFKYGQSEVGIVAGPNGVNAMFGWMTIGRLQFQFHYPDEMYISAFFVNDLFRGAGIGTKMLEVGLEFLKRNTATRTVRLHCIGDRVAFYQRAGFELQYGSDFWANTMELTL